MRKLVLEASTFGEEIARLDSLQEATP